jgi:hypothetical protein
MGTTLVYILNGERRVWKMCLHLSADIARYACPAPGSIPCGNFNTGGHVFIQHLVFPGFCGVVLVSMHV